LGLLGGAYIRERGGAARVNPTPLGSRRRSPTLAPFAPRGPSSREVQCFFPARVGCLGGAAFGAQGRTMGEGGVVNDKATAWHCYYMHNYTESLLLHLCI